MQVKIQILSFQLFSRTSCKTRIFSEKFLQFRKAKMPLDSTQRPLKIPQRFTIYPERNDVFDVFERMMSSLIISKPADPLKVKNRISGGHKLYQNYCGIIGGTKRSNDNFS